MASNDKLEAICLISNHQPGCSSILFKPMLNQVPVAYFLHNEN